MEETNLKRRKPVRYDDNCKLYYECDAMDKILYIPFKKTKIYGDSDHKRNFMYGFYEDHIPAAIVQTRTPIKSNDKKEIEREYRILKELDSHENVIRHFCYEKDTDFIYIATELCMCSVEELLDPDFLTQFPKSRESVLSSLPAKEILRQATIGVDYLHQNNFVHRNIKPNNFLIKPLNAIYNKDGKIINECQYVIKITDFRLTRKWEPEKPEEHSGSAASEGWVAPECFTKGAILKNTLDVFLLGCFYNYVLTGMKKPDGEPKHPFGGKLDRASNIQKKVEPLTATKLSGFQFQPEKNNTDEAAVKSLIESMIHFDEANRPQVLKEILDKNLYFKPSGDYNIYGYNKPGLCLIVNQQKFDPSTQIPERKGSNLDCVALDETFRKLGFKIEIENDLTSLELTATIKTLACRDLKDYGCLVVCLLSHGIENALLCYDGKYVNINKLKYEFSLNKCPSLYGKPKIFIVQACQGELEPNNTGIKVASATTTAAAVESTVHMTHSEMHGNYDEGTIKKILKSLYINDDATRNPPIMDCLTIKSTIPGFVSYRSPLVGSPFIQGLCQVLKEEYACDKDPVHLGSISISSNLQSKVNKTTGSVQTVVWEAFLSKEIKFRKIIVACGSKP